MRRLLIALVFFLGLAVADGSAARAQPIPAVLQATENPHLSGVGDRAVTPAEVFAPVTIQSDAAGGAG